MFVIDCRIQAMSRYVTWASGIAAIVLAVVWLGSGFLGVVHDCNNRERIGVFAGCLLVQRDPQGSSIIADKIFRGNPDHFCFQLTWQFDRYKSGFLYAFPLWIPTLCAGVVCLGGWLARRRIREHRVTGACAVCGYPLLGLATSADKCPECGNPVERPRTMARRRVTRP